MRYKGSSIPYRLFIYPMVQFWMLHLAFWFCPFEGLISPISWCDMVRFSPWYGLYCMLKRCLLHDGKMVVEYKTLMFSILSKALIFCEFAPEGESARKYALDFWGRTENSNGKTAGYWKSVSGPYCNYSGRGKKAVSGLKTQFVDWSHNYWVSIA